ncbi:th [Drosophila busckii]|uniref:Th n=1 Tax=Drosophila busckii TaxID=30019 RepID=A0A0M3QVZ5_DROBS|nr:death-associated inhibitor of apoptosis 1 [Drosophila busckii]XP_017843636.1 death-associated inhibitor of apoptosis 1 [Drosophila busckii]XP_017843637.1 death-associated inhibitor of apoptosis 1 [Drosophila busckii]ALC43259.1 th [Drosophila busckii]
MADVATTPRYINPFVAPATAASLDQVDDGTNATNRIHFRPCSNRMHDKYQREDERLRTFDSWPLDWLDKQELAQTGMFYTNEQDKVKCYFCEVEIGCWERTDQPVPEHMRWSPNCPLLRRRTTNNVPINAEALDRLLPPISYDICGSNDTGELEVRAEAYSEGRSGMMQSMQPAATTENNSVSNISSSEPCRRAANSTHSGNYFPEYPEYAIESARLRSFTDWPRNMKQKPVQLAEAGFFYTGVGDRVRCFSCGGGLKDWDDNDEPWEQHALWLSQCRFVKLIKGQTFIDSIAAVASNAKGGESEEKPLEVASPSSPEVAPAAISCDVAPATAATRIYEKIVAQTEGAGNANPAPPASLHEEGLCKICYAAEYNTAFLPCGHVVACAKCASSVTKCPLCRKPFTDVMRVYFS